MVGFVHTQNLSNYKIKKDKWVVWGRGSTKARAKLWKKKKEKNKCSQFVH
jgi:hypothetical protein